jgi:predicted nucleic-acid-binding Zn-ribbon protein
MRFTQVCPKCSRQKFAVTKEFRHPDHDSSNVTWPLPAITIALGAITPGQLSYSGRASYGRFEAWICLHCGFTELYVHELPHDIEAIVKQHPEQWGIVDATPPEQGPYR